MALQTLPNSIYHVLIVLMTSQLNTSLPLLGATQLKQRSFVSKHVSVCLRIYVCVCVCAGA